MRILPHKSNKNEEGGFLIVLFYTQTLAINQLSLLPYRFFWQ